MKRLIVLLLLLSMLFCTYCSAEESAAVLAGSDHAAAPGETVTVTLDLRDNPGLAAWKVELAWDAAALSLDKQSIALSGAFSNGMFVKNADTDGKLSLVWANTENVASDGALFTLTFTVSPQAHPGTYAITVTTSGTYDENGEKVTVASANAGITLPDTAPANPGESEPAPRPTPTEKPEPEQPPVAVSPTVSFTDMNETAYYYQPALWAAENGITTGTTDTTFSPDAPCSRAQAVTFLWRAAGCPEPAGLMCPFTDVAPEAYYRKAVLWAVEKGITTGTTDTTFSPDAPCTRAQIVTFLYRNIQAEGGGFQGAWMFRLPFTDMPDWAFEPIAWCYMKGITTGTTDTTFSPDAPCTRGQIVTFLYRSFAENNT